VHSRSHAVIIVCRKDITLTRHTIRSRLVSAYNGLYVCGGCIARCLLREFSAWQQRMPMRCALIHVERGKRNHNVTNNSCGVVVLTRNQLDHKRGLVEQRDRHAERRQRLVPCGLQRGNALSRLVLAGLGYVRRQECLHESA
jgi:hypothetical protein